MLVRLKFTSVADIPIISNLEIGATFAGDFNSKAGIISGYYNPATNNFNTLADEGQ